MLVSFYDMIIFRLLFSAVSSAAIETLLDAIIPLGTLLLNMATDVSVVIGSKFVDFLSISSTVAGYGDGSGHIKLMQAVVMWLQTWYGFYVIHSLFGCCLRKNSSLSVWLKRRLSQVVSVLAIC